MLKKLLINGKKIPVPVPIHNLSEAAAWIEKHLLRPDHTITRIILDGREIDLGHEDILRLPALPLTPESDLRCKIDSPMEICVQTIDALRNLSTAIGRNLKPVAVHLWEYKGSRLSMEARAVIEDARLMIELLDHILVLIDRRIDITNVTSIREAIDKAHRAIQIAESQSDWKGLARVLLQQLEEPTLELSNELSSLQKTIYEAQADRNWERRAHSING
ncbi:MAG TPA: hypothetical protein VE954_42360 [Oligoflexus sp.]|uniref:hypothetical protein n=1 Tax=Oligoflexus sp. TaxID=1971216 RepID=UPI002D59DA4E|nr:hypothetical protein [Oligoflexus sp.]HYX39785.1 hypothetical protein [Oligoflexus sp.]